MDNRAVVAECFKQESAMLKRSALVYFAEAGAAAQTPWTF